MKKINLPTKLTILRILIVPVIIILLADPTPSRSFIAAIIFTAGGITDWLDGYLARTTGSITPLGKLLDPIADKILVISVLFPMVAVGHVPAWVATIMVSREVGVAGVRMMAASDNKIMAAGIAGKWKTGFELTAMVLLMLQWDWKIIHFQTAGMICLVIAIVFSLVSALDYFNTYYKSIKT